MMDFSETFCSSPWFSMRIHPNGDYGFCRWGNTTIERWNKSTNKKYNIKNTDPFDYFQNHMSEIRYDLLSGKKIEICQDCHLMEHHGKISGRKKQLLKTGIDTEYFNKSLLSSPWFFEFDKSYENNGCTNQLPVDWQIDLGNYCNSGCIFCNPESSSRLHSEFKKIGIPINGTPSNWSNDPILVDKLINGLKQIKNLRYIHFIGGEPLIMPSFEKILNELIKAGINKTVSIGLTTNLTVWNDKISELLSEFHEVNLGLSIECLHPINDYLRYGSKFEETKQYLDQCVSFGKKNNWLIQLRTTPTVFSIFYLDTLYDYALKNEVHIESCNFIDEPEFMRPSVIPKRLRRLVIVKLKNWVDKNKHYDSNTHSANNRSPKFIKTSLIRDLKSYIEYLENMESEEHRIPQLLEYINKLEISRNNSILKYAPEYKKFLQRYGYNTES